MPQLDIYTYFTQFQWLLIIFTILFVIINRSFISTFQSFFFSRNFLLNNFSSSDSQKSYNPLSHFDLHLLENNPLIIKNNSSNWDQLYEKLAKKKKLINKTTKKIKSTKTKKTKIKFSTLLKSDLSSSNLLLNSNSLKKIQTNIPSTKQQQKKIHF